MARNFHSMVFTIAMSSFFLIHNFLAHRVPLRTNKIAHRGNRAWLPLWAFAVKGSILVVLAKKQVLFRGGVCKAILKALFIIRLLDKTIKSILFKIIHQPLYII